MQNWQKNNIRTMDHRRRQRPRIRKPISSGKFDGKFKRALLDYYSYGFKNLGSFDAKRRQTLSEDWPRLNRVISDYLEWSEDRNEVMFASIDSLNLDEEQRMYTIPCQKRLIKISRMQEHHWSTPGGHDQGTGGQGSGRGEQNANYYRGILLQNIPIKQS